MTLTLKAPKFGYVCGAAFDHELFCGGLNIYQSIKQLKEHESCWKECGIVKVKFAVISRTKGKPLALVERIGSPRGMRGTAREKRSA